MPARVVVFGAPFAGKIELLAAACESLGGTLSRYLASDAQTRITVLEDSIHHRYSIATIGETPLDRACWNRLLRGAQGLLVAWDVRPSEAELNHEYLSFLREFGGNWDLKAVVLTCGRASIACDGLVEAEQTRLHSFFSGWPIFHAQPSNPDSLAEPIVWAVRGLASSES